MSYTDWCLVVVAVVQLLLVYAVEGMQRKLKTEGKTNAERFLNIVSRLPTRPAYQPCTSFRSPGPPYYAAQCLLVRGHAGDCTFVPKEEAQRQWSESMKKGTTR